MSGMMQSFLSTNYLEGKKKTILSPEEGATATLEQGVTDIQSPNYTPAPTSTATPMTLPGGVSPIPDSSATPIKVQKSKPVEIKSSSAVIAEAKEQQQLVAEVAAEEKAKKRNRLLMAGAGAGVLLLLLNQ